MSNTNTKNILIIAHDFYPINIGGSHRPFRMAKYLKKNNINPIIITTKSTNSDINYDESLNSILEESNIEVINIPIKPRDKRSNIIDKYYFNVVGDTFRRWKDDLDSAVQEIIKTRNLKGILITVPPFSVSQLIFNIKNYSNNIPIYLDFRDAWSSWNIAPYASIFHYWATVQKENNVVSAADHILVTSKITLYDLKKLHSKIDQSKFLYIPNSFDGYIENEKHNITIIPKPVINIGYFGSFYYNPSSQELYDKKWFKKFPYQWFQYSPFKEDWSYRSPLYFLKSLNRLFLIHPEYRDKISINFVGVKPQWLIKMIEKLNLSSNIILHGILDKKSTLKLQEKMDYLLLTSSKRIKGKDYSIAGKTFEYLSHQKPILGFFSDSAQKDLLEKTGVLISFNPDDINKSSKQLKFLCDNGITITPNRKEIDNYLTSNCLRALKDLINES